MDETKQFYMEHGICYACGQERAEPGKKRCWRCLANNNDASKLYYGGLSPEKKEKLLERRRQAAKEQYAERKKAGLCPVCGKENPNNNLLLLWRYYNGSEKAYLSFSFLRLRGA